MSFRRAVNDKCRECIYCESGPGKSRQQTAACTAFSCPLYSVRPMPNKAMVDGVIALGISEMGQNAHVLDLAEMTP